MTSVLRVFFLALALDVYPEVPPWTVSGSPSHSDLRQAQWTAWEPGKVWTDCLLQIFLVLFPVCLWQFLIFEAVLSQLLRDISIV